MACSTLQSILKSCDNNSGGIFSVAVFPMDDILTSTEDAATWTWTALTIDNPAVTIEFNRNTGNFTEEGAIDTINGSSFVNQTINLVLTRREAAKSKAIKLIGEGQQYLGVALRDANENYWYFPNMQLTAYGEGSGTARADGSKYSLTLSGESDFLAKEISKAIYDGLFNVI